MKKTKIMLTAIAVLAVVGGTLAFKANTFNTKKVWITPDAQNRCTEEVVNKVLTTTHPTDASISVTDVENGQCILTYSKTPASN